MRRADDEQNFQVHESGSGPGLVLLCGDVSASIANARGTLFAEEGYAVLNLPGSPAPSRGGRRGRHACEKLNVLAARYASPMENPSKRHWPSPKSSTRSSPLTPIRPRRLTS